jgi:nicotinamide phosphoribosyltransferase
MSGFATAIPRDIPRVLIPRGPSERIFAKRTDGYKPSHWLFYSPGITEMYDYMTSRGGMFDKLMMFGAQAHAMKYLCGRIITPDQVRRARKFYAKYYGSDGVFNHEAWMDIATRLEGRLPLKIMALPEGLSGIPVQTPMMSYINTDPKHGWLSGYLEPLMFKVWNTITVASLSQHIKMVLYDFLKRTGTPSDIIWKLHDFGYRGVSSEESAEYAGGSHLVNFWGTDTVPAIDWVNEFYSDGKFDDDGDPIFMPGYSVRATEHSVMTHRGRKLEPEVVREILAKCPNGIIAMVGDSYDIFNFAENIIGTDLHKEVIEREGIVVIRPDSGDPIPTMMKINWILKEKFGTTINDKGYQVFGREADGSLGKIKTLQGDKNDYEAIYNMCRAYEGQRFSLDNLATFGMGGALLQASTRDTQKMAVKLSSITNEDGTWGDVYKDPITDPGKGSKCGRFAVVRDGDGRLVTLNLKQGEAEPEGNLLRTIYENGEMLVHDSFQTVRERADEWMAVAA